jgi:hypothetical protein
VGRCRCGLRYRARKSRNARARYWHLLTVPFWIVLPLLVVVQLCVYTQVTQLYTLVCTLEYTIVHPTIVPCTSTSMSTSTSYYAPCKRAKLLHSTIFRVVLVYISKTTGLNRTILGGYLVAYPLPFTGHRSYRSENCKTLYGRLYGP